MRSYLPVSLAFLALVTVSPLALSQQQSPKRVGVVIQATAGAASANIAALREGLRERGWIEGQNLILELRFGEGKNERLGGLFAELVRMPVDVLVTVGTPPTLAAKKATQTIPIVVAAAGDPVGTGLVTPGGNVAALDFLPIESTRQQVALLQEVVPSLSRIAVLYNGNNPSATKEARRAEQIALAVKLQASSVEIKDPAQLEGAFAALKSGGIQAILVVADPQFLAWLPQFIALARSNSLPALFQNTSAVEAGGLIAYGPDLVEMYKASAEYVDRILKGARPADLPVGNPPRLVLAVNLSTAKAMGIVLSQTLLNRANKKIE